MAVSYGGQAAFFEKGVMRSPGSWAVAIRTPEGDITEVVRDIEGRPCSSTVGSSGFQ